MLAYKGISATRIIYVVNYICGLAGVLVKYVRRTGCKKDDERIDCYGVNI